MPSSRERAHPSGRALSRDPQRRMKRSSLRKMPLRLPVTLDRCPRSRHPAAALRRRSSRRRGALADRRRSPDRPDAAGDRQKGEDARRADRSGGAGSDRRICSAMSVSAERRRGVVPWSPRRAAKPGPGAASGRRRAAPARPARHADAACSEAQLCNASAGARRGSESASGTARPREPLVDADLHGGGRGTPSRRLSPRPPPRLSRSPKLER